ncbi:MAG: hypothetical protein ACI9PP_001607 [Halobacteriales archaeon]|jgi:hypothetical protein
MARGKPAMWGIAVGGPITGLGVYTAVAAPDLPNSLATPFILLGIFVILLGFYVRWMAPEMKTFDERVLATFHPNQLAAKAFLLIGGGFFLVTIYLLFGTYLPYVYPTLSFSGVLFFTLTGLVRYWRNSLTTYYVTTERITSEYRFLSLQRTSVSIEDISAVGRKHSVVESLVGLGTVGISAGGGNPTMTEIRFQDIEEPDQAEEAIERARGQSR